MFGPKQRLTGRVRREVREYPHQREREGRHVWGLQGDFDEGMMLEVTVNTALGAATVHAGSLLRSDSCSF